LKNFALPEKGTLAVLIADPLSCIDHVAPSISAAASAALRSLLCASIPDPDRCLLKPF
jgi:hypothetical protein